MRRFLKTLAFLIASLSLLVSGVDATLDRQSHAVGQNSLTVYNQKGNVVLAYDGDLSFCKVYLKQGLVAGRSFLHRT